jgi:propionyl-CoA synthetase
VIDAEAGGAVASYAEMRARSREDPEGFWAEAAESISWCRRGDGILDDSDPPLSRWFPNWVVNTCYNALDRHVAAGHGDRPALVYESAVTGASETFTYRRLTGEVARFAGVLRSLGVHCGHRVVISSPMIPETVIAMLACARIGAIHATISPNTAPRDLAARIDGIRPRVILWATDGPEPGAEHRPILDEALEHAAHRPRHCVILRRRQTDTRLMPGRDLWWDEASVDARPAPCMAVQATDPLYVLYVRRAGGALRAVVRDNGGHAVALSWAMEHIYGAGPGEAFWAASDHFGVVGHSCIVYGPLLRGCTTVLFEGTPAEASEAFGRVAGEHEVRVLLADRAVLEAPGTRAWRPAPGSLRALFPAGGSLPNEILIRAERALGVPVIEHWWRAETGWPISAILLGADPLPVKRGSAGVPMPGYGVRIVEDGGRTLGPGETGAVVLDLPLPPGTLPTLWRDDAGYVDAYLSRIEGSFITGESGSMDADGYLSIAGRTGNPAAKDDRRVPVAAIE